MTRKHYELIAEIIRTMDVDEVSGKNKEYIIRKFAGDLRSSNLRFDVERFTKACYPTK
jgi:hypothetical protein